MICDDCGKDKPDVEECECPFASDVWDEKVIIQVCYECYQERLWDI